MDQYASSRMQALQDPVALVLSLSLFWPQTNARQIGPLCVLSLAPLRGADKLVSKYKICKKTTSVGLDDTRAGVGQETEAERLSDPGSWVQHR